MERLKLTLVALVGLLGAACSQTTNGTSTYVVVSGAMSHDSALPAATEWCGRYGKTPNYRGRENYRATFDCVSGS